MKHQEIQKLIERFLNAETTLQEEQQLMEYFRQSDIPEDLLQYREMLLGYDAISEIEPSEEDKITISPAVKKEESMSSCEKMPHHRIIRLWHWAAAACVAAILCVYLNLPTNDKIHNSKPMAEIRKPVSDSLSNENKRIAQVAPIENNTGEIVAQELSKTNTTKSKVKREGLKTENTSPKKAKAKRNIPKKTLPGKPMPHNEMAEHIEEGTQDLNIDEQKITDAILADIESEVLWEQKIYELLYNRILEDINKNITSTTNQPELSI